MGQERRGSKPLLLAAVQESAKDGLVIRYIIIITLNLGPGPRKEQHY